MVKQTARDLQTPFHPSRVLLHDDVGLVAQFDEFEHIVYSPCYFTARHFLEPAVEIEVFPASQVIIETRILEHDPY